MQVITCHFNPCGYQRLRENYWTFRQNLTCPLITVELSFNGQFEIPDAIHIDGTENQIMWQKERLLNIALEQVTHDAFAWVDADIIFENENWQHETEQKLECFPVVQPFQCCSWLDANRNVLMSLLSDGYAKQKKMKGLHHCGFAWAGRTELFKRIGLYDADIIGGGDSIMLACFRGDTQPLLRMSQAWRRHGDIPHTQAGCQRGFAFWQSCNDGEWLAIGIGNCPNDWVTVHDNETWAVKQLDSLHMWGA